MAITKAGKRKPKKKIVTSDGNVSSITSKGIVQNKSAMSNLSGKQLNARLRQALRNEKAYNTQALKRSKSRMRAGTILGSQGIASSTIRSNNQSLIDGGAEPTTRDSEDEREKGTDYEGRWYVA